MNSNTFKVQRLEMVLDNIILVCVGNCTDSMRVFLFLLTGKKGMHIWKLIFIFTDALRALVLRSVWQSENVQMCMFEKRFDGILRQVFLLKR